MRGVAWTAPGRARPGPRSTGHALPAPNTWGPIPTHLQMEPGTTPRAESVRGVKRGLFVTRFNYTRVVHPLKTLVTGLTRDGTFLIEDWRDCRARQEPALHRELPGRPGARRGHQRRAPSAQRSLWRRPAGAIAPHSRLHLHGQDAVLAPPERRVPETGRQMVVHEARRLHEGVADRRAHEAEAARSSPCSRRPIRLRAGTFAGDATRSGAGPPRSAIHRRRRTRTLSESPGNARALDTALATFRRLRTMPGSSSKRAIFASPNRATRAGSKSANARR